MRLSTGTHDRDVAGLTYVYPVVSRRAGGVSVGVNLNPNNACNWRCVYCQVPDLVAGKGPPIDLERLRRELAGMLAEILRGDYLERHVPAGSRRLTDVAFSGNGEPTGSPDFGAAVDVVLSLLEDEGFSVPKLVVITNGSMLHKEPVRAALERLAHREGEVWFKLDSATEEGQERMNSVRTGPERTRKLLALCARACPTWVQTMFLARAGAAPSEREVEAYLELLSSVLSEGVPLEGVLVYGLARRSHQPEAPELSPLPLSWMEEVAERIRGLGLEVRVSL